MKKYQIKNNLRKMVSILLMAGLAINLVSCAKISTSITIKSNTEKINNETTETNEEKHVEGKYPIHFDLSDIYNNIDEWNADYEKINAFISTISELRGTINSAGGIYNYVILNEEGELPKIINKLDMYVNLNKDLDTVNSTYLNLLSKLNNLLTELNKATSFFEEEMKKIPIDELNTIFEDERLAPYKYYYHSYFLEDRPKYSKETLDAIIEATSNYGGQENVFDALQYADIKDPMININGEEKVLDDTLYDEIIYGDYGREIKKEAENLRYGMTKDYINTLTALLYNHMKEIHNAVKLDNGDEVLKHTLEDTNIDREIYDNIIKATHKILPEFHRYLKLKKEKMNVDELYYIDTLGTISKYEGKTEYDEAVDNVREALKILGDEYIDKYNEMVTNGHIDVYPDENKVGGGYETSGLNKDIKPFILLNYTGFISEVKTLAHEIGHAIFSAFADENANITPSRGVGIFLQEIASTFNENIFTRYRIDNTDNNDEKLYFVEDRIIDINSALIRQIMYTEFEDYLYKKIENNENFDAEDLCNKWVELNKLYYGDDVTLQDNTRYRWSAIPHLYYVYYTYKYATSITYSSILANNIYEKKDGAVENYIAFLKNGEPEKPADILRKIGIDPNDSNIYDEFIDYYKKLVDDFENLIK